MDSSAALTGPAANSPSDVYSSSGVSHTSTRTTSPSTSSHPSSPLLDLLNLTTTNIEHASNTLLDSQPKMDRSAINSINQRRDKLVDGRNIGNTNADTVINQFSRQLQQPQRLQAPATGPQTAPRSLASNWRAQPISENIYNPIESHGVSIHHGGRSPSSLPVHSRLDFQHSGVSLYPNMTTFSDPQLETSFAYCYDRGNGKYTPLIPADMLPPLRDIPALQQGCQGMVVLSQPRASPPNGRSSDNEPIAFTASPPTTPTTPADNIQVSVLDYWQTQPNNTYPINDLSHLSPYQRAHPNLQLMHSTSLLSGHDSSPKPLRTQMQIHELGKTNAIAYPQSRIDTIVASTPPTPIHGHRISISGPTSASSSIVMPNPVPGPLGSHHHHSPSQQSQRRPKIYCDKWVHEGVCAFTQQGCKYKHEMPFDKVTQHQLGLFHGLPAWWKKHQADLARQRDVPSVLGAQDDCNSGEGSSFGPKIGRDKLFARENMVGDANLRVGGSLVSSGGDDNLTWRQRDQGPGDGNQSRMGLGSDVGGQGIGPHGPSVWNPSPSPFGPIAPPQRTLSAQTHNHTPACRISTNNPYASLEALDESTTEKKDGARLV